VEKPERKRTPGRPRRTWEDNININLQKVERSIGWIDLAQDRERWRVLVNAVLEFRV
jgi:hypothetical protein